MKQHRIEIITFAVALTASAAVFLWMEFQKPGNGIFSRKDHPAGIRHRDTGEIIATGRTRLDAVQRFATQLNELRKNADAPLIPKNAADSNGNRAGSGAHDLFDTLTGADLSRMTLSNVDISGVVIREADLTDADFRESLVLKADFEGSDFSEADLSLANLSGANFSRTNLSQAQFVGTTAHGTQFREADLSGAHIFGADFRDADFTGANLHNVSIGGSTRFSGVILNGALNVPEELRARAEAEVPVATTEDASGTYNDHP